MWYCISLGDGLSASIYTDEINRIFQPLFDLAGCPDDMAVFTRQERGTVHCEVIAYFSPAAAETARAFSAKGCNPPDRQGLELLAGSSGCWAALF